MHLLTGKNRYTGAVELRVINTTTVYRFILWSQVWAAPTVIFNMDTELKGNSGLQGKKKK